MVNEEPTCVTELADRLSELGWISTVWVAGSLATGDYVPGVSDLDLVALIKGPADRGRRDVLARVHRALEVGSASASDLGCAYVEHSRLTDLGASHPTWTHGGLVSRVLSGITRAELVLSGYAVMGQSPQSILAPVSPQDIRAAARAEVSGYWRDAARHPWWWLDPVLPDLGLTSMARARHAVSTGQLLGKTRAIEQAAAPAWYVDQMRARRQGASVVSPRIRAALIAWNDARRTVRRLG